MRIQLLLSAYSAATASQCAREGVSGVPVKRSLTRNIVECFVSRVNDPSKTRSVSRHTHLEQTGHDFHVLRREAHVHRRRVLQRAQVPAAAAHQVVDLCAWPLRSAAPPCKPMFQFPARGLSKPKTKRWRSIVYTSKCNIKNRIFQRGSIMISASTPA